MAMSKNCLPDRGNLHPQVLVQWLKDIVHIEEVECMLHDTFEGNMTLKLNEEATAAVASRIISGTDASAMHKEDDDVVEHSTNSDNENLTLFEHQFEMT